MLHDILEWNDAYLDYKNNNSKQWKNWDFSKEGTLWFLSKISNFLSPFYRKNEQQNVFQDILKWKDPFIDYENNQLQQ